MSWWKLKALFLFADTAPGSSKQRQRDQLRSLAQGDGFVMVHAEDIRDLLKDLDDARVSWDTPSLLSHWND